MRRIRLGMVGGGRDAFIGAVHRTAARLDDGYELVAGALSSSPEKSIASARDLGLPDDRGYGTWRQMLEAELARPAGDRIEAVSIVTPNDSHHAVAGAFADAGIHVICDKPLVTTLEEAADLEATVARSGVVFCVTYNYSGYPMVKQARHLVRSGALGDIRKVIVEYNQGWLATDLEATGQKQAAWRTDPGRAGPGGAIGDIGSHAEQLASTITGLRLESLCADLTSFVPGRRLDDDANLLLRFEGGARGLLFASQVSVGQMNDLRIRVFGTAGSLHWRQEEPNHLVHKPLDGPDRVLHRGTDYLCPEAQAATRLPFGHPEAFIEAFANVYRGAREAMLAAAGEPVERTIDYPGLADGVRGVRFITKTIESAGSDRKWTPFA